MIHHASNNQLRSILPDDYAAALALWNASPGVRASETREEFDRILQCNPDLGCVAIDDNQIVGTVLCCHDGRRGYLYHLAVAESHRRRGIAKAMVERCLAGLAKEGIARCSIFLVADNDEGEKFWESIGWRVRSDLKVMAIDLV